MNPTRRERNMLFVPAARWAMIGKAAASAADAVCIDLEDSVPAAEKEASRANVVKAFTELDFGKRTRMYRINAVDTGYAYRDLIEVVEAAGNLHRLRSCCPRRPARQDVQFVDTLADADRAATGIHSTASGSKRRSRTRRASSGCARSRVRRRAWSV
jgi:citrate lyase subunit beta/citryl-CoA lyase